MSFEALLTELTPAVGIAATAISVTVALVITVVCVIACRSTNSQQSVSDERREADIDEESALLLDIHEQTERNATALQQQLEEADRLARNQVELNRQKQALLAQLPEGTALTMSSSSPSRAYQGPGLFDQLPPASSPAVELPTLVRSSASPSSPPLYSVLEPLSNVRGATKRRVDRIKSKEANAEQLTRDIEEKQAEINQALADCPQTHPMMLSSFH